MTTYAELTQQIIDYTETDSNVLTTAILNDIIEHAESRIFRNADLDVFKKYKTANLTIGDPFVAMPGATPQLFAFIRYIQIFSTDNVRITLEKKDTSFINEFIPNRTTTGTPKYYANWDNDTIILAPSPDATYTVELAYNAQPTGLSSSNTTTWVSNNAPEMLLYACLVEAFKFLKNPQMVQMYESYYKQALQPFVGEQMGRRRRDEYMDGVPRIAIPSENP
jgi:hypothetical protein|tara:strand:+ start:1211 stop:1876 length:666 start_codon:yes stop_codon:yes gene_type:complete